MAQQIEKVVTSPKPFVKWAGGKRQILPILHHHFPKSFGTYFEPFLGGGAVLFHLLSQKHSMKCKVSDLNSDLILSYVTIRDHIDSVIDSLKNHARNYKRNPKKYFYQIRNSEPKNNVEKTSRLIFLNRTCFNGLYRVNSKGKFNVPLGKYTNPVIVNEDNLMSVSHFLRSKNIEISCRDFSSILNEAKKDDFIYLDPPYYPTSKTANFTSYTSKNFGTTDLKRLVELCYKLDSKGCLVLLSNSNSTDVCKHFDKPWKFVEISANRSINSNSKGRKGHSELLIKNF